MTCERTSLFKLNYNKSCIMYHSCINTNNLKCWRWIANCWLLAVSCCNIDYVLRFWKFDFNTSLEKSGWSHFGIKHKIEIKPMMNLIYLEFLERFTGISFNLSHFVEMMNCFPFENEYFPHFRAIYPFYKISRKNLLFFEKWKAKICHIMHALINKRDSKIFLLSLKTLTAYRHDWSTLR